MLELKYASPQIGLIGAGVDLVKWSKALLLRIHVITGWTIPEAEILNILVDQFGKKLIEDYPMLNVDEVEYAFRRSGTAVKDWGKAMNLSLIDEVLKPYVGLRRDVSDREERMVAPPEQVILSDQQLEDLHREDIENFYQRIRNGRTPYNLPEYFKPILVKDGLMKEEEELSSFFIQRLGQQFENIYVRK